MRTLLKFSSSFILFPTRTRTRNLSTVSILSTVECSLKQVASDIDLICKDFPENLISRFRLAGIKHQILSDSYILSPLLVKFIEKENLSDFMDKNLPDYPDSIMVGESPYSKAIRVIMTKNKEDAIVLLALSVTVLRVLKGCLPKDGYRLADRMDSFYSSLAQIGKVERLIKLDLMMSARTIPFSVVEERIRYYVADDSVYRLISSFLNLPIMDEDGNNRKGLEHFKCIPEVGEITNVLLEMILMETFDRFFPKRFPGIGFFRLHNEAYFFTKGKMILDDYDVYKLLMDLGLVGTMVSIGHDDEPLLCYHKKLIYLGSDKRVYLCDPKDV